MLNFNTREFPNLARALGGWGKGENIVAKNSVRQSEGAAEGGCGGNSAAPERIKIAASPAALLVQSRATQKSFLFLLEEKIRRAQIRKSKENFFVGQCGFPARRRGGFLSSVQSRFAQSV